MSKAYKKHRAVATPPRNDLDGRGNLSEEVLTAGTRFARRVPDQPRAIAETSASARSCGEQVPGRVQLRGQHLGGEPRRRQRSPLDRRRARGETFVLA